MLNAQSRLVNIVVAVDTEGGYSKAGTIPWDIPEDMERFKKLTDGGVCIMGRHTYLDIIKIQQSKKKSDSSKLPRQILPGRESFVVSSDPDFDPVGAKGATSVSDAINSLADNDHRDIFILGGWRLYIEALGRPCYVHMSIIKGDSYQCDKFFPVEILNSKFTIVSGDETDTCYNVEYHPIPQERRVPTQQEIWEKVINENFRAVRI